MVKFPFDPVVAKQFHRMLGANGSIPAAKVVGCAVLVASPADAFRMLRVERDSWFCHWTSVPRLGGRLAKVAKRLMANVVTAVISMIADTGILLLQDRTCTLEDIEAGDRRR